VEQAEAQAVDLALASSVARPLILQRIVPTLIKREGSTVLVLVEAVEVATIR
jgi:hypothetical protein